MHCGTILPKWMPKYWWKPPAEILGDSRRSIDHRFVAPLDGFRGSPPL